MTAGPATTRSGELLRVRFQQPHRHAGRDHAAGDVVELPAQAVDRIRALGVMLEIIQPDPAPPRKSARLRRKAATDDV